MASPSAGTTNYVSKKETFGKSKNKYTPMEWAAHYKLQKIRPANRRAFIKGVKNSDKCSPEWKNAIGQVAKDNPKWLRDKPKE